MDEREWLSQQFEEHRTRLRSVAYRMLGSLPEAEDAVQETWLRLTRTDASKIENLGGWLTTVVARVCLNMLRARRARVEEPLSSESPGESEDGSNPEQEALLADAVGLALLVVLQTLSPPQRLAYVLHDMFDVPFNEIARIVDRSPQAARQLASRARRRVRGTSSVPEPELERQRVIVDAFLTAARDGDFASLVNMLDPEVVLRTDSPEAIVGGAAAEVRGAQEVARRAIEGGAQTASPALVDGEVGVVVAPHGRLSMVFRFGIEAGKIVEIDVIADPEHLRQLNLTVLDI